MPIKFSFREVSEGTQPAAKASLFEFVKQALTGGGRQPLPVGVGSFFFSLCSQTLLQIADHSEGTNTRSRRCKG